ncbi:MAG: phosphatidylserine decarboxylase [Sphingomonas sp.]|uniref:phosphatidylserine decarboxylase n=1 Tax=unclassified Sphingomonas TaxID=196159 RepID=UPI002458D41B|nr:MULTISPECIES: phosphatidylserine decarboxylase [unclassified Sphingomonas]MBQ1499190.1 phosphatidylserine decarboxylase [Sphingomonas sp.]MDH4746055.1 phosphatidylserine decarboxylase [Sphingomonas sp. CBMAI 2297]
MASMDKPPLGTSTVKWRFPDIHPEGRKYVAIAAAIALASLFIFDFITWPLVFLAFGVAAFFRDPIRVTPQGEGMLIAPADGLVTMIQPVELPPELRGPQALGDAPMVRVSIFMSVFDVHVNRTPITGTIRHVIYISGRFLNADLDKASEENERQHFIVEDKHGLRIGFTQIAGLVARRIVSFTKPGDMVVAGQRVGLIRFGSRVDVFLPADYVAQVTLGQRTIAGETIIARKGAAAVSGISQ